MSVRAGHTCTCTSGIFYTLAGHESPIKPVCKDGESARSWADSAALLHLCCTIAHVKQSPSTFGMDRHRSRNQSRAKMIPMSARYCSRLAACSHSTGHYQQKQCQARCRVRLYASGYTSHSASGHGYIVMGVWAGQGLTAVFMLVCVGTYSAHCYLETTACTLCTSCSEQCILLCRDCPDRFQGICFIVEQPRW